MIFYVPYREPPPYIDHETPPSYSELDAHESVGLSDADLRHISWGQLSQAVRLLIRYITLCEYSRLFYPPLDVKRCTVLIRGGVGLAFIHKRNFGHFRNSKSKTMAREISQVLRDWNEQRRAGTVDMVNARTSIQESFLVDFAKQKDALGMVKILNEYLVAQHSLQC